MTVFALTLALLAAVMHAVWNLLVKSSEDQLVAGWTVVAGAAILALPVLVLSGLPDRSVWDLILGLDRRPGGLRADAGGGTGSVICRSSIPSLRTSPVLVSVAGVAYLGDDISPLVAGCAHRDRGAHPARLAAFGSIRLAAALGPAS